MNGCQAVAAVFVFGPRFCGEPTEKTIEHEGETFYVCAEHDYTADQEAGENS